MYISAEGLDELKISSKDEVSATATALSLDVLPTDLKEYIKKATYGLRSNTLTDAVTSQDHVVEVKSTFFVNVKILGL